VKRAVPGYSAAAAIAAPQEITESLITAVLEIRQVGSLFAWQARVGRRWTAWIRHIYREAKTIIERDFHNLIRESSGYFAGPPSEW
jgi:hypothetical protein